MQVRRYRNNNFALTYMSESELQTIKESLGVEVANGNRRAAKLFKKIFLTPKNQRDYSKQQLPAVRL